MTEIVMLHNARCSTSRATLALLEDRGFVPRIVDYIAAAPSTAELEAILAMLDMQPRELMRRDDARYAQLGLDDPALGRAELVAAMHENPQLIQRPIVLANGRAALGRPPENVLSIL